MLYDAGVESSMVGRQMFSFSEFILLALVSGLVWVIPRLWRIRVEFKKGRRDDDDA